MLLSLLIRSSQTGGSEVLAVNNHPWLYEYGKALHRHVLLLVDWRHRDEYCDTALSRLALLLVDWKHRDV